MFWRNTWTVITSINVDHRLWPKFSETEKSEHPGKMSIYKLVTEGQAVFTCDCLFHYLMLNCQGGISVWMYLYLVFSIIVLVFHFCIRYFVFDADLSWRDFRLAVAGVERGEGFDCWLKIKKFLHKIGLKIYKLFFFSFWNQVL